MPTAPRRELIVLAKAPVPGLAKTRLCPPLTLAEAAAFAAAGLVDTVAVARAAQCAGGYECAVTLAHPAGGAALIRATLGTNALPMRPVPPGDVGAAMAAAFSGGAAQVALIGSDLPALPPAYIAAAFAALDAGADVALGPAEDGGYYLVATTQPRPELFAGMTWSTDTVFAQTVQRAEMMGLTQAHTPTWYDVDSVTELLRCARELDATPDHPAAATRAFLPTVMHRLLTATQPERARE